MASPVLSLLLFLSFPPLPLAPLSGVGSLKWLEWVEGFTSSERTQDVAHHLLGIGAFNGFPFHLLVYMGDRGVQDICKDSFRESFEEELHVFRVRHCIPCITACVFKGHNVFVNLREFHPEILEFIPGPVFSLRVHILLFE